MLIGRITPSRTRAKRLAHWPLFTLGTKSPKSSDASQRRVRFFLTCDASAPAIARPSSNNVATDSESAACRCTRIATPEQSEPGNAASLQLAASLQAKADDEKWKKQVALLS